MPKEQSVAPKERVNITYKPATGDAMAEKELPLKLFMIGDYTLRPDERPLEEREVVSVDKDNFNDVLREQKLSVNLNVKDKLSERAEGEEEPEMAVKLDFEDIKDFSPDKIVRQVPELNRVLQLREALVTLKGPLGNMPAFRKRIQGLLDDEASRKKLLDEIAADQKQD
jgi:type VI secretion system protein ImpB